MSSKQKYFDQLIRRAELLNRFPDRDNEASRHDQLVYPILTSEYGLRWHPTDLISQSTISVPKEITESHIFRGAVPKVRKPDILICPPGFEKNVGIIEEKKKQTNLSDLNSHRVQTHEYQCLYQCTWAILTDGERWIVKRNFETYHEFSSINEVIQGMDDLYNCLGRNPVIERLSKFKTCDILLVVESSSLLNIQNKSNADSEIFGFENNIPVIVCGVKDGEVTSDGKGYIEFRNLGEALDMFPDLHPRISTKRFTWAMKESSGSNSIKRLRFEAWPANDLYSR